MQPAMHACLRYLSPHKVGFMPRMQLHGDKQQVVMILKRSGQVVVLVLTIPNSRCSVEDFRGLADYSPPSLQPQGMQMSPCIDIKCTKTQKILALAKCHFNTLQNIATHNYMPSEGLHPPYLLLQLYIIIMYI